MKSDIKGCSTCLAGQERYEECYDNVVKKKMVQYDYRAPDGNLFSMIANSLESARARRDAWLSKRG